MRGEEPSDALLRLLNEDRAALIERVVRGDAPSDNISGGYRDITGQIKGLDRAIARTREIFYGERIEEPERPLHERLYGV